MTEPNTCLSSPPKKTGSFGGKATDALYSQVTKAVKALLAHEKTKESGNKLILNEHDWMSLMVTVWRIPNQAQTIKIPLPHGIRPDTCEVCLFTKDEPNMTSEQTENFYKKMLTQQGITQITKVIPLKTVKKEYKPYEAKRRLLASFDLFLADARIRRLLPSHIGKHFYKEKREPQSVNLKAKQLAPELNRFIQGTQLHITNKGCCYTIRVGHTGMKAEDIVENTLAVARLLHEKLPMKWRNVKILHLKTQTSVALPIYNSTIDNLKKLESVNSKKHKSHDDEDIPELVPILDPATPKTGSKEKSQTNKTPEKEVEAPNKIREAGATRSAKRHKASDGEAKTPSKKKGLTTKQDEEEGDDQESTAKPKVLKKTPKKATCKSAVKLTKASIKKANLTKNVKRKRN